MPISSGFGKTLPHHDIDKIAITLESKPSTASREKAPRTAFVYPETTKRVKRRQTIGDTFHRRCCNNVR